MRLCAKLLACFYTLLVKIHTAVQPQRVSSLGPFKPALTF